MSSKTARPTWLQLQPERLPVRERLGYSLKGPLFAASVVFEAQIENEASDSKAVVATAHAKAKLPLIKSWEYRSESRSALGEKSPSFNEFNEVVPDSTGGYHWMIQDGELTVKKESSARKNHIKIADREAEQRVFNSALLLFAANATISDPSALYASYFVAGGKLFALRMTFVSGTQISAQALPIKELISEKEWTHLPWQGCDAIEISWSSGERSIQSFRYRHHLVGAVELRLTQRERD